MCRVSELKNIIYSKSKLVINSPPMLCCTQFSILLQDDLHYQVGTKYHSPVSINAYRVDCTLYLLYNTQLSCYIQLHNRIFSYMQLPPPHHILLLSIIPLLPGQPGRRITHIFKIIRLIIQNNGSLRTLPTLSITAERMKIDLK